MLQIWQQVPNMSWKLRNAKNVKYGSYDTWARMYTLAQILRHKKPPKLTNFHFEQSSLFIGKQLNYLWCYAPINAWSIATLNIIYYDCTVVFVACCTLVVVAHFMIHPNSTKQTIELCIAQNFKQFQIFKF